MSQGASVDESVKKTAVRWLFGQEASTIILALMLIAGSYGCWKLITESIPKHLEQIHSGYKEISKEHTEAVRQITVSHEQEIQSLQNMFEKTLDRIERRTVEKANTQ